MANWAFTCSACAIRCASLNNFVCSLFKYSVYINNNKTNTFIKADNVVTRLLNGLITNSRIIKMENAEHMHNLLVLSVKINKLNGVGEFI